MIRAPEGAGKRAPVDAQPISRNSATAAAATRTTTVTASTIARVRVRRGVRGRTSAASGASSGRAGGAARVPRTASSTRDGRARVRPPARGPRAAGASGLPRGARWSGPPDCDGRGAFPPRVSAVEVSAGAAIPPRRRPGAVVSSMEAEGSDGRLAGARGTVSSRSRGRPGSPDRVIGAARGGPPGRCRPPPRRSVHPHRVCPRVPAAHSDGVVGDGTRGDRGVHRRPRPPRFRSRRSAGSARHGVGRPAHSVTSSGSSGTFVRATHASLRVSAPPRREEEALARLDLLPGGASTSVPMRVANSTPFVESRSVTNHFSPRSCRRAWVFDTVRLVGDRDELGVGVRGIRSRTTSEDDDVRGQVDRVAVRGDDRPGDAATRVTTVRSRASSSASSGSAGTRLRVERRHRAARGARGARLRRLGDGGDRFGKLGELLPGSSVRAGTAGTAATGTGEARGG